MSELSKLNEVLLRVVAGRRKTAGGREPNLLPELLKAWQRNTHDLPAGRIASRLQACQKRRGMLFCVRSSLLGLRAVWWPQGVVHGQLVCVLSSRIGRNLASKPLWMLALRQVVTGLDPRRQILLTAPRTTCHLWVSQLAHEGIQPLVVVDSFAGKIESWLERCFVRPSRCQAPIQAIVSPPLHEESPPSIGPVLDACLLSLASTVFVLGLRSHGGLIRLLLSRVSLPDPPSVRLVTVTGQVDKRLTKELIGQGATLCNHTLIESIDRGGSTAFGCRPCKI